jgi:hypothetical protein
MYQRDYILRMIEMIGDLIAGIFGLIRKGKFEQAENELGRIYYDMLREDSSFFKSIPKEKLTNSLLSDHNYTNGHLEILAELFNAEAALCFSRNNKMESLEFSEKSLILFEFVDKEEKILYPERLKKIETIRERIRTIKTDQEN